MPTTWSDGRCASSRVVEPLATRFGTARVGIPPAVSGAVPVRRDTASPAAASAVRPAHRSLMGAGAMCRGGRGRFQRVWNDGQTRGHRRGTLRALVVRDRQQPVSLGTAHYAPGLGNLADDNNHASAVAVELRPEHLDLWAFQSNTAARRFYERRGFVSVDTTDGENEERACCSLPLVESIADAARRSRSSAGAGITLVLAISSAA
jgi:hypothetical protein